jgi:hypothetical protein
MKILAAAVGATALANIPGKWINPDVQVGVLPAHAQTSPGLYTLAAGASEPDANYCFDLSSTAVISPPASGILLRYSIIHSADVDIASPNPLTGTVPTDAAGGVSLPITVNTFDGFGSTVTVTWSFENPSDGANSGNQIFTSGVGGC